MSTTYVLHRALLLNRDGVAIMFEDRRRTWSELGDRVARLAGALKELGVGKGHRVAVLMLNQDRYLELYFGVAWVGAVIVPLNIRCSAHENEYALRDCRPALLVVDAVFGDRGSELAQKIGAIKLVYADDAYMKSMPASTLNYDLLIAASSPIPDAEAAETDLAGIFYTGGTTGRAKGVMLSHRNLLSNARNWAAERGMIESANYLHAAPMFHITGAAFTHAIGALHAIIRTFTPDGVAQAIERLRVTEVFLVPTMIQMFVDEPGLDTFDLSSLRRIAYGASPMSEALLDRAMAKLPSVEFMQGYGMTELSPLATILHWKDHIGDARRKGRHRSAGRPVLMVDVRIVDPNDKPLPAGVVGEIAVRGDNVMMGYWERPEETEKAVIGGWMHTGDAGYMDEGGYVYIVDRIKDMIISGGENIYPAEVENCIAQHPAVAQCAVIGIPSERWGEAVHAVVMRRSGATVTPEDIIEFCKKRVAGYKCPRSVAIQDEMLPLSGAGKILKRELRKPFWEQKERQVS
jgi:long-chain acyl-CoA synthetase